MRDLALDSSGDLDLSARALRLTAPGAESVGQKLRVRLGLTRGDWFLDRRVGVPYYTDVMGKQPAGAAEALLRRVIATCPGVAALLSFAFARGADRRATVTFSARATTGEVVTVEDFIVSPRATIVTGGV